MDNFKGKHGPLLIAEIGGNHEGDFDYAKKLTQLAINSDVDFVKFQIYSGDKLVSNIESPQRNAHFKKFELTRDQHVYLASMVRDSGLKYTSSVWDVTSMDWIDPFMELYKIGSGDITAYPMLRETAQKGKPIIVSTGLCTEEEVLDAVGFIQNVNEVYKRKEMLAILQCTSMYPIANTDANLSVMERYKSLTGVTVGYSDHTEGIKALIYAAAMGAEVLEFHFTDSREGKVFRDHKVSLIPEEIDRMILELGVINDLRGSSEKQPVGVEIENGHLVSFRRAVYPNRDMLAGEVINSDDLTVLRPNHGIDARDYYKLIGRTLKVDVKRHQSLSWGYFEEK